MATSVLFGNISKNLLALKSCRTPQTINVFGSQQIRNANYWPDWRMKKDYNKRMVVVAGGAERIRINTIRKNDILPREIRELADEEVKLLPHNSNYICLVNRCAVTSRPKGCVWRWRVSRIIFRALADYNKLSGVQRAMW